MKYLAHIAILAGVLAGIYALFVISPTIDIALGFFVLSLGLLAIFWTINAYKNLSPHSTLRNYTAQFLVSLVFVLLSSIWTTVTTIVEVTGALVYLSYIFTSVAYVAFVIAAYKILNIGKEFGFKEQSNVIRKALKKSK